MVSFDPNRPDFAPYGLTCVPWVPSPMGRPDHHNEMEVNLLESGWVTYLLGGRKIRLEPGSPNLFWAAIPHQIVGFGEDTRYYVATIPFAWFLQWRLPDSFVQPMLKGEVQSDPPGAEARSDLSLFAQWASDLGSPSEEVRDIVLLEMEARLMRMALRAKQRAGQAPRTPRRTLPGGGLKKVERIACLVAQRYTEHLTVEAIGREVGLHPNYAMNLFKATFGTTLVDYLTHHRISHAQRLLATTDMKIVDVALESGFNSISRFNEAFRRVCGCSPRDFRRRHDVGAEAAGA